MEVRESVWPGCGLLAWLHSSQEVCVKVEWSAKVKGVCFIPWSVMVFQHWKLMRMKGLPGAEGSPIGCGRKWVGLPRGLSQYLDSRKEITAMRGHFLWEYYRHQIIRCRESNKNHVKRQQRWQQSVNRMFAMIHMFSVGLGFYQPLLGRSLHSLREWRLAWEK